MEEKWREKISERGALRQNKNKLKCQRETNAISWKLFKTSHRLSSVYAKKVHPKVWSNIKE